MTATATLTSASTPLLLEPNALYLILLDRGDTYTFHWKLYLTTNSSTSPTAGQIFHITNEAGLTAWEYETSPTTELPTSRRLLLALQVGVLDPVLHRALGERLALVPLALYSTRFWEHLSCRVWVKEALFALDDEGYVSLGKSVREIEEEAKFLGILCKSKCERRVGRSVGCIV
ncbi:hypothetical protein NUU61_008946 [Penicillium alfredii]|uniref:Uncharacterized protein n=1 Tax=Penicillium alfredii TaxID=1506179 RepID=A0A9W9EM62_9EURO|nr:uncharacterized protein NUU61_008946 [Penicillium alfredii]KAJ5084367.1 hypothetical protein NUU61_008946 [Penicillium alfredii]